MWDTEPAPAGGPLAGLRRWLLPLLGLAAAGAFLVNRQRAAAPAAAPVAAVQQQRKAAAAASKAAAAAVVATAAAKPAAAIPAAAAPEVTVRASKGKAASAYANAVVAKGAPLTAEAAARQVQRLQAAKSEAMGAEHRAGALGGVMRGKLLRQWRAQVQRARDAGSHYVYQVRSVKVERVGPWLPPSWMARGLTKGAEVTYTESDTVTVRSSKAGGARGESFDRTLRRTLKMQKARWPGSEWRVVDIVDAA